jgi:hypothetical protein
MLIKFLSAALISITLVGCTFGSLSGGSDQSVVLVGPEATWPNREEEPVVFALRRAKTITITDEKGNSRVLTDLERRYFNEWLKRTVVLFLKLDKANGK